MKRIASIVGLAAMGCLFASGDVRGGAGLVLPGSTSGPTVMATVVTDVTGGSFELGKGLTSVRLQRAGSSAAALFTSSYVAAFVDGCLQSGHTNLQASTNARFTGLVDGFIDTSSVNAALFSQFGDPRKAAITDTDYATCTSVPGGAGGGTRQILSFTASIQFEK